ncbi:hypothetical protein M2273_005208 [Mucilaginibacter lappiensis]
MFHVEHEYKSNKDYTLKMALFKLKLLCSTWNIGTIRIVFMRLTKRIR